MGTRFALFSFFAAILYVPSDGLSFLRTLDTSCGFYAHRNVHACRATEVNEYFRSRTLPGFADSSLTQRQFENSRKSPMSTTKSQLLGIYFFIAGTEVLNVIDEVLIHVTPYSDRIGYT